MKTWKPEGWKKYCKVKDFYGRENFDERDPFVFLRVINELIKI